MKVEWVTVSMGGLKTLQWSLSQWVVWRHCIDHCSSSERQLDDPVSTIRSSSSSVCVKWWRLTERTCDVPRQSSTDALPSCHSTTWTHNWPLTYQTTNHNSYNQRTFTGQVNVSDETNGTLCLLHYVTKTSHSYSLRDFWRHFGMSRAAAHSDCCFSAPCTNILTYLLTMCT